MIQTEMEHISMSQRMAEISKIDSAHAEEIMNQLYDEMGAADIINFDTVAE